jgi:hypothetical protein
MAGNAISFFADCLLVLQFNLQVTEKSDGSVRI